MNLEKDKWLILENLQAFGIELWVLIVILIEFSMDGRMRIWKHFKN
jgi:hypothetical protein